jgi:hypothetical protein
MRDDAASLRHDQVDVKVSVSVTLPAVHFD